MININLPVVYKKDKYIIYKSYDGYILHNSEITTSFAHTHLEREETARWLIELSEKKRLPYNLARYLVISLLRVNDDYDYCRKINDLLNNKRQKSRYVNCRKAS